VAEGKDVLKDRRRGHFECFVALCICLLLLLLVLGTQGLGLFNFFIKLANKAASPHTRIAKRPPRANLKIKLNGLGPLFLGTLN
jgi:hypothetical protein